MSEVARLREIEERARQLRTECQRLLDEAVIPADVAWRAAFEAVAAQAKKVEDKAISPVKLGVVGEFSAGKTLLLGSLIGYADGLPISELPTTGNVTALQFDLAQESESTEVGPFFIRFLDHDGFVDCLRFMLQLTRKRAKAAELRVDLVEKLSAIRADDPSSPSRIEEWCSDTWSVSLNPSLRYLLRELTCFVRSYARCGVGLCESGEPFEIPFEIARAGLNLSQLPDNIQNLNFTDLPSPSTAISSRPERFTSDMLRDSFPLIESVTARVRVSKQVWDFSNLPAANRFVLMDFPGLGADSSGARDLYLCLRELEDIQTILILLDGRQPGGSQGTQLYNLLQEHRPGQDIRDMILVAVGRFDQLPLRKEGEAKLRELGGVAATTATSSKAAPAKPTKSIFADEEEESAPPPPTSAAPVSSVRPSESSVLKDLPVLKECVMGAESLVPPGRRDRVSLVSPLLHLRFLEEKNVGMRIGSEEFMTHARADWEEAERVSKLWKALVERMERPPSSSRSKASLATWLEEFAIDGGINRLRDSLQSHVQIHGLAQRLKDVEAEDAILREKITALKRTMPSEATRDGRTTEDKLQAAERELRNLVDLYRGALRQIQEQPRLGVTRDGQFSLIEDALQEEVIFQVYSWVEWDLLFQNTRNGRVVERTGPVIFKDDEDEDDDDEDEGSSFTAFPTRSEDFFHPFENTLHRLEEFTLSLLDDSVGEWLSRLSKETVSAQAVLAGPLSRKTLTKEIRRLRLGESSEGLVPVLRAALDPSRLKKLLFPPEGSLKELEIQKVKPALLFPLARSSDEAPGRMFAWSSKCLKLAEDARPEEQQAHLSMVLRIRDEMVSILCQQMSQLLGEAVQKLVEELQKGLQEMTTKLGVASGNRFVLETILTEPEPSASEAVPDGLNEVRRVAAFYP